MEILIFDTHRRHSAIIAPYKLRSTIPLKVAYIHRKKNLWSSVLEANKIKVPLKSFSLNIRIDSVNQILKNKEKVTETRDINILTRITDQKIPCLYNHVFQIIKSRGPGPCNYLRQVDNRKYFSGLSLTRNRG